MDKKVIVELTTEIVSAHASVNEMNREDLLDEIQAVFQKLNSLVGAEGEVSGSLVSSTPLFSADSRGKKMAPGSLFGWADCPISRAREWDYPTAGMAHLCQRHRHD